MSSEIFNADTARKITDSANSMISSVIINKIKKAAEEGLYVTILEWVPIIQCEKLKANGFKVEITSYSRDNLSIYADIVNIKVSWGTKCSDEDSETMI